MPVSIQIPNVVTRTFHKFMQLNVFVRATIVCSIVIVPISIIVSFVLIVVGERSMCLEIDLCSDMF